MRNGQLWTWRDGRFVRMVLHYDAAAAWREAIVRRATAAYGSGDLAAVIYQLEGNPIRRARFFLDQPRAREAFEGD